MLLQRMILDDLLGLNYDYMGNAHYEGGATYNGRLAIAQAFIDGQMTSKLSNLYEVHGKYVSEPVPVVVMCRQAVVDKIGDAFKVQVLFESLRTTDKNIVAWLNVGHEKNVEPLLILRADLDNAGDRVDKFFANFVEGLRAQAAEAAEAA